MTSTTQSYIGVFDSGIGGLSVWREIVRQLPNMPTLYFADQAHIPYGPRPLEEVRSYAIGITRFLLAQGAKVIVVACNTASGAALYHLRTTFPHVPFVGMEPAVKPAAERSQRGIVGVIATPATLQGDLFRKLSERFAHQVTLKTQVCPGLVECVEAGKLAGPEVEALLHRYLDPLVEAGIDHLVLGCTHYPFLSAAIQRVVGSEVTLIDPAPAVARQVKRVLKRNGLLPPTTERLSQRPATSHEYGELTAENGQEAAAIRFYTTGAPQKLAAHLRELVPPPGTQSPSIFSVTWKSENGLGDIQVGLHSDQG